MIPLVLLAVGLVACSSERTVGVECEMNDSTVNGEFALSLEGWPDDTETWHDIDTECVIDAISSEDAGETTVTSLTCIEGDGSRPATLRTFKSPAGDVAWTQGATVRLRAFYQLEQESYPATKTVEMRLASDDGLLVGGSVDVDPESSAAFAPLFVTIDSPCGIEGGDTTESMFGLPLRLQFTGPADEVVSLFHQQRDVLVLETGEAFAIEVPMATTNNCCHQVRSLAVLAQRVL